MATVRSGNNADLVEFVFVIPADEGIDALTVEEFLLLPDGEVATVQGYIYKYNDGSYLVSKDGVAVLAYKFQDAEHGDYVVITGEKDYYNGTPQFVKTATLLKLFPPEMHCHYHIPMTIAEIVISDSDDNLFGNILVEGTVIKDPSDNRFYVRRCKQKHLALSI